MRKCDPPMGRPASLLDPIPDDANREHVLPLVEGKSARIERIVTFGQASPSGFWYDQDLAESVAVLTGSAGLRFEDAPGVLELRPGDHVLIPAHRRHRVEWTDTTGPTIWLAVHFS